MFVCVRACVYSGMPPNAGSVADPLLPYINPESIHLWAEPWNMFSSAENFYQHAKKKKKKPQSN